MAKLNVCVLFGGKHSLQAGLQHLEVNKMALT